MKAFFDELPFHPPLIVTPKGDALLHLEALRDDLVVLKVLASIQRGAGRAAMEIIVAAADRHGVTLDLIAKPQRPSGEGKKLTRAKLEAFYRDFGFVVVKRVSDGWAFMVRETKKAPPKRSPN